MLELFDLYFNHIQFDVLIHSTPYTERFILKHIKHYTQTLCETEECS